MTELIKPFPNASADLSVPLPDIYPHICDLQTRTARIALVSVGPDHPRSITHPQFALLETNLERLAALSSAQGRALVCGYEGAERPLHETSPDFPIEQTAALHADSGWVIHQARKLGLQYESWDLLTGDGVDMLMSRYRGDCSVILELDPDIRRLWRNEQDFGQWLAFHHIMKHRTQWLAIAQTGNDPGEFLSYALERLEAHRALEAFERNDIDVHDMGVFEAIHEEVCYRVKIAPQLLPLNPRIAPTGTTPAMYAALHTPPYTRLPGMFYSLTKLQLISEIADSNQRNIMLASLVSNLLVGNRNAFLVSGGWHNERAMHILVRHEVERAQWYVGAAACQEAFTA